MKALSVKQPWANLIACGKKCIETRTWRTDYRGELLIVSSKTPKVLPYGHAVALVELRDCRPMAKRDEVAACCEWYPGAYAWVLRNIRSIMPFPMKGALGIFEVDCPPIEIIDHHVIARGTFRGMRWECVDLF